MSISPGKEGKEEQGPRDMGELLGLTYCVLWVGTQTKRLGQPLY
jgi:hypothetical protein